MANPNIVNVTTILGNTSSYLVTSNSDPFATALVSNPDSSGKIFKINTILVSNVDGSNVVEASVKIFPEDDLGGNGTPIISTVNIPADATLIVVDKSTSLYLLENKSLGITANTANALSVTCSWEEIS